MAMLEYLSDAVILSHCVMLVSTKLIGMLLYETNLGREEESS
jgi:hypothetical protein